MQDFSSYLLRVVVFGVLYVATPCPAEEAVVAVATNFLPTAEALAQEFMSDNEEEIQLRSGSTGQLFAQTARGAPFDVFLSADKQRVDELVKRELAQEESRFTYAIGRICFYMNPRSEISKTVEEAFKELAFDQLAIANPRVAPYGDAALRALDHIGYDAEVHEIKIVTAQSVGHAFTLVSTGSASFGIVALSSLVNQSVSDGHYYVIPDDTHPTIRQDAVLLNQGSENRTAKRFLSFLTSKEGKEIIRSHGYASD